MKSIIYLLSVFWVITSHSLSANEKPLLWSVGETLVYKVNWSFFRLGTLKMTVVDTMKINDHRVYHAIIAIDSNPVLFFINQHSVFRSYFDDELNTHLYQSKEHVEDATYQTEYRFNYADSILYIDMTDMEHPEIRIQKQKRFYGKVLDGTSLLYYARLHAGKTGADTVFYLFAGEPHPAIIHFKGEGDPQKISGLKNPVETFYLEGFIPGKGIAGLSDKFNGWFARHKERAPVKAKLKVFIGHVNLELESWEKCSFGSSMEDDED